MIRAFREVAETVITAAVIFVILQTSTQTFRVVGPSMMPTLLDGQHLLVNKFVYSTFESDFLADLLPRVDGAALGQKKYLFHGPHRGDIIIFRPSAGEPSGPVGRVTNARGDEIDIDDGTVSVNDGALDWLLRPGRISSDLVKRVIGVPGDKIDIRDGKVFVNDAALAEDVRTLPSSGPDYPLTVPPNRYFVLGDNRGSSKDSRAQGFVRSDSIVGRVLVRYWPPSMFKIF